MYYCHAVLSEEEYRGSHPKNTTIIYANVILDCYRGLYRAINVHN